MSEPVRLFVLAGEASGDRLGADLVRRLRGRVNIQVGGVGGAELEAEGMASLFPMSDLAVMGWSDVVGRLPLLLWRVRQVARKIISTRPDVVVLIDSQVFTKAVAKRVRRAGLTMPMLLYVSPTVWAYHPQRAPALVPLFDEVLAILPFEPGEMARLGGPPTHFVGHPSDRRFPARSEQPERGPLMLLPGSRRGELRRHLPLMRLTVERFRDHPRVSGFIIPTLEHLLPTLREETSSWPAPVSLLTGEARRQAWEEAYAAFVVSGTATLELAMGKVPMVVTYKADRYQAKMAAKLGREVDIALPNIILGRRAVPELQLHPEDMPDDLPMLRNLLDSPERVAAQLAAFDEMRLLMQKGAPEAPLEDPAERVLAHLGNQPRLLIGS